ncbi:MAG: 2OG-Fe(II) oxygenase [Sphingomonadaceae bacterium]|nr:2OG-Fe(II) oxygenase [Sphingomonadaceae bacterium]
MAKALFPKYAVLDEFLPPEVAQGWLDFALARRDQFEPTTVIRAGSTSEGHAYRRSLRYCGSLGEAGAVLEQALRAALPELLAATGLAPFPIATVELDLTAHGDGAYFRQHTDTLAYGDSPAGDRLLTAVYYVHVRPAAFTGGDLLLHPYRGNDEPIALEARHNRLVSFPSIAPHEVAPVSLPGDRFEDMRFAVNCWVLRARG